MRSLISKKHSADLCNCPEAAEKKNEAEEEDGGGGYDDGDNTISVTTHLYLKPSHSTDRLDKQVVLRRIRHRKRVSKVKSSPAQALLNSNTLAPKISTTADHDNKSKSIPLMIKWADDAFAAP